MANLNIEKKDRPIWPWIVLGIVLLAAIAWWLMSRDDAPQTTAQDTAQGVVADGSPGAAARADDPSATIDGAPEEVNDFLRYTAEHRGRADADLSHDYTADGIRRLASALGAITERDTVGGASVSSLVGDLRDRADALQRNQEATTHSRYAREAFVSAGNLMQTLQQQRYPNARAEVEQVQQSAQSIDANGQLLAQRTQVQGFFDQSARAVRAMLAHGTS